MKNTMGTALAVLLMASGCQAKEPPTQVVYRFDDHRFLELKGWDCEGELWYTDTQRGIHSQPYSQFYRIFTKKFIHPSERYIVLTSWGGGAFTVSKDFGKTWQLAQFSPGENEPNGDSSPAYDEVLSLTVINDQGFLLTKHRLYMSSRPFDDPRVLPGGSGIKYQLENGEVDEITSDAPGWKWGMVYFTKGWLKGKVVRRESNYQNLPDKVPEVKDYTGWDHMQCDMDAGR
ncbi:T6SS immunity protein Tli3 family protein [Enterobacter quasiroggenkampii]|uniref:T6SS immunity protein Tli3 family protein n=1 Tax=Enterobacter quasiroggenkampii TaxID=2497436 RepID=UPI0020037BBC|nr:hypothetical protein [Enterobacter quasiroggenkampii]MCK7309972.1 hypothetical protein [Enterobacter quasiroggenkampii]